MVDVSQEMSSLESGDLDADYWLVCLHEVAGCPAILRLIVEVPDDIDAGGFGDRVAIIWNYESEHDGLPKEADSARMDFFEDVLVEAVESRMNACLAIVATAKGAKEWTVYAEDGNAVVAYAMELARENNLPVQTHRDLDPDWEVYHRMLAVADEAQ
jgi:Family of unknown function (DUF695)